MRGDGHSERGGMLLKGMYSSSSSEISFSLACAHNHKNINKNILTDEEIIFCFVEK